MRKQRGWLLTCLVIGFGAAITVATFVLLFNQEIRNVIGPLPGWFGAFLILFLLARLAALIAVWNFRRWGVYALLALECVELVMGMFVFTNVLPSAQRPFEIVLSFVVFLFIWFLVLRAKWKLFV